MSFTNSEHKLHQLKNNANDADIKVLAAALYDFVQELKRELEDVKREARR